MLERERGRREKEREMILKYEIIKVADICYLTDVCVHGS